LLKFKWLADCSGVVLGCGSMTSTFLQRWDERGIELQRHVSALDGLTACRLVPSGGGSASGAPSSTPPPQILLSGCTDGTVVGCSLDATLAKQVDGKLRKSKYKQPQYACRLHHLRPVALTKERDDDGGDDGGDDDDKDEEDGKEKSSNRVATFEMNDAPEFVDLRTLRPKSSGEKKLAKLESPAAAVTAVCCLLRNNSDDEDEEEDGADPIAGHAAAAADCEPTMLVTASAAGIVRCQHISAGIRKALALGSGKPL
jgi:hypothetical protein